MEGRGNCAMKNLVVTLSGYEGTQRFNLIKLISYSGGSYVGSLSPSTTHLVCLKFEGKKYNLAKKLRIHIVNHRWVEDCILQGRPLPEHPYTLQSGVEAGKLLIELSIPEKEDNSNKEIKLLNSRSNSLCDDPALADEEMQTWISSRLLRQDVLLNVLKSGSSSNDKRCKGIKKLRKSKQLVEKLPVSKVLKEEYENKGSSSMAQPQGRKRKRAAPKTLDTIILDSSDDKKDEEQNERSESKGVITSNSSCTICLSEISPTLGVLQCGHRYCYECIENWSKEKKSRRKIPTCPLCNAAYTSIMKEDGAVITEQKVYTQTMPFNSTTTEIPLAGAAPNHSTSVFGKDCSGCQNREPEEMLVYCACCQTRCIHEYCMDPFLMPWICSPCKQLAFHYRPHI